MNSTTNVLLANSKFHHSVDDAACLDDLVEQFNSTLSEKIGGNLPRRSKKTVQKSLTSGI